MPETNRRTTVCGLCRAAIVTATLATGLGACASYKTNVEAVQPTTLTSVGDPRFILPANMQTTAESLWIPPVPAEQQQVMQIAPLVSVPIGWLQLRLDLDATGEPHNIRLMQRSSPVESETARLILAAWNFTPATVDGVAVPFRDMEVVIAFAPALPKRQERSGSASVFMFGLGLGHVAKGIGGFKIK